MNHLFTTLPIALLLFSSLGCTAILPAAAAAAAPDPTPTDAISIAPRSHLSCFLLCTFSPFCLRTLDQVSIKFNSVQFNSIQSIQSVAVGISFQQPASITFGTALRIGNQNHQRIHLTPLPADQPTSAQVTPPPFQPRQILLYFSSNILLLDTVGRPIIPETDSTELSPVESDRSSELPLPLYHLLGRASKTAIDHMADKTSIQPLQPSTLFYATSPITTSTLTDPIPSSSTTPSSSSTTVQMNAAMTTPQRPGMERKQFDIQSLMSPPEPTPHDTFGRSPELSDAKSMAYATSRRLPMSPPVSPATKIISPDACPTDTVRDPILYAESQGSTSSQSPLFVDSENLDTQQVVKGHIAARDERLFRQASPPRAAEYELALGFKFQVMRGFLADRRGWYNRERAQLLEDRARANGGRRYTNIAPASGFNVSRPSRPAHSHSNSTSKVTKPVNRTPRQAPAKAPVDPNKVKAIREDKDYNSVPDYCPPLSSLPSKHNSLKVDWKGAPVDLKSDPDYHLLHPDEVLLASNLRLDCATYLTSKRRIFVRRLECLRIGKEFRKTDSQQACKIDVNKASKLWQAFEKVGWLQADWVKKYL